MSDQSDDGENNTARELVDNIEICDELEVEYEKRGNVSYSLTAEVRAIREIGDGIFEVDITDYDSTGLAPWKRYTLNISRFGVSVETDYPSDEDNQVLGSNATVNVVDGGEVTAAGDAESDSVLVTDGGVDQSDDEVSRYVTVFHQLKDTEHSEEGQRVISLGKEYDDRYVIDEETEGFVPVARPIAVIDAGVEMDNDELGEWCNSHAGETALEPFFSSIEPDDPTLPDCEEYLEVEA